MKAVRLIIASNEVDRITQNVRKRVGRKAGNDGVGGEKFTG